jgi:hypothetical protein
VTCGFIELGLKVIVRASLFHDLGRAGFKFFLGHAGRKLAGVRELENAGHEWLTAADRVYRRTHMINKHLRGAGTGMGPNSAKPSPFDPWHPAAMVYPWYCVLKRKIGDRYSPAGDDSLQCGLIAGTMKAVDLPQCIALRLCVQLL